MMKTHPPSEKSIFLLNILRFFVVVSDFFGFWLTWINPLLPLRLSQILPLRQVTLKYKTNEGELPSPTSEQRQKRVKEL